MPEPLAHLYALALRALDEQERRAEALRGRLGPVLAAAALGASLLSGPIVGGDAPASVPGALALVVAIGGFVAVIVAMRMLLRDHRRVRSDVDVRELTTRLQPTGSLDDPATFYTTMFAVLGQQQDDNEARLDQLAGAFTAMLCGILAMLCGLASGAIVG